MKVLAIVGPTASGKTSLSLRVAGEIRAEMVSVDSAQIYRGMDIGTAKPSKAEQASVAHHLIDVAEPSEDISVMRFQSMARASVSGVSERGNLPLLVGGSGLYFRAVVDPLEFPGTDVKVRSELETEAEADPLALYDRLRRSDPEAAERIEPANVRRVVRALEVIEITGAKFSSFRGAWDAYRSIYDLHVAGLTMPREELDRRIDERVDRMIDEGLEEEVRHLMDLGWTASRTATQALGYAQMTAYLEGRLSLEEAKAEIKGRTRKFARRQLTWFRADPRIHWFEDDPEAAAGWLKERAQL